MGSDKTLKELRAGDPLARGQDPRAGHGPGEATWRGGGIWVDRLAFRSARTKAPPGGA